MAEVESLDLDTTIDDDVSFQELDMDVDGQEGEGVDVSGNQGADTISHMTDTISLMTDTISQMSTDEPDGKSTGKRKKKASHNKIIQDGLLLSLKGQKQAFASYTYSLTPVSDSPSRVDWKILTTDVLECQHVYLHQLQPGDSLQAIATKHKKSHMVAVILVNMDDSLKLPPAFSEGVVHKSKKNNIPVILISSEDGACVRELLNQYDTGELHAKIESKNHSHVESPAIPDGGMTDLSSTPMTSKLKHSDKGSGGGIRISMRRFGRGSLSIKDDIKSLMFPLSGPVCVSEDNGLFQAVMSTLYQHEQTCLRGSHHGDKGALFRKLSRHLDDQFAKDFPFYLLVADRVQKKEPVYQCDELGTFVHSCVDKFEKLEPSSICKTLESFLKLDNFKIMFNPTEKDVTVFKLLEQACVELMKLSFFHKSQGGSQAMYRSVYCRMLWISVAYKCCVQRGAGPRDIPDYWQEHLIAAETFIHLSTDTIQSIKRGVEFGRLLQLPDEVSFSSQHMGDVLTSSGTVRPFHQMREFVIILEPYIQLEEEFVECFVTNPRTNLYYPFFSSSSKEDHWLKTINPDGNLLAVLQEGIGFLDTVLDVSRKRQWLSKMMHDEIKEWLSMLMQTIDITNDGAESYLKDLLSTKVGGVTKLYCEHIKRNVIVRMEENFGRLKVEHFLQLYKAFLIWPNWVVEKYLRQYKIPPEVKICSPTWNEFFSEFVDRFKDAHHHNFLLEFLKSVSKCYLEQGRTKYFVLDLLALDAPDLFMMEYEEGSTSSIHSDNLSSSVPDEFTHFVTEYIQMNHLQEELLAETEKIWALIADHSNFQQLVLLVLQQELIPESLAQQMTQPLRLLLDKCVKTICQNLDSLTELSSRLDFCWGMVGSCCDKMHVSESLEWAKSYYHVIDQLGKIYSVYSQRQIGMDTKSVLNDETMPQEVANSTCDGVKMFFDWLSKAQQVLAAWRDKFTSKQVNYDNIQLYLEVYGLLNRAATSITANSLVVDSHYVHAVKTDFLHAFEQLNVMLLRYIYGQPDDGYCSLCEILTKYGVGLPNSILITIKKHVSFPGENKSSDKKALSVENSIPSSISCRFNPGGPDIKLELTRDIDFLQLRSLVRQLTTFLTPVEDNLDLLTFFYQNNSEIFDKYLKHQLKILEEVKSTKMEDGAPSKVVALPEVVVEKQQDASAEAVTLLGNALENTKEFVLRLIQGNAMYTEIIASGSLNLRCMDIDGEFAILNSYAEYAKIDMQDAEGLKGMQAMLQLFQYARHINVIHCVCGQFGLETCLEDEDMKELMELAKMLDDAETKNNLTAKDAIEKMKRVAELLCLDIRQNHRFLDLFSAVSDSADFHQFIVQEKQFVEESGRELFVQQYQLITTQLQHEEYKEVVLNHLFAAFKMIMPFTQKGISFRTLMAKVSELNAYDGRRQLDTVNRNINLIRLWFSRAEGDTVQGVASELACVLDSGSFCFHFKSSVDCVSGALQLIYFPHIYQNVDEIRETSPMNGRVLWNEDQIEDFVRKLGFLDAEGDAANQIKCFICLKQTAKKLLDLFTKLRELGHPDYLLDNIKYNLHCTFSQDEADEMVYNASLSLTEWQEMVASLRSEYEKLVYFSIPKLLHLYQNLIMEHPSVGNIVADVGILFQNKHDVKKKLRRTIRELIRTKPHLFSVQDSSSTAMQLVGAFLSALFENSDLSTNSLRRRRTSSTIHRSMSQQPTHILHACQNFTASQLVRTVIGIFGGVPEPFEVFHCRPTVTEEELRLFLNPMRATKQPFQFLILEVNKLPYHLQEALLRIHYDLKHQQMQGDVDIPCTHFVESGSSLLQEMPWVLHKDYKGLEPDLDFVAASSICKKAALYPTDFQFIQLVYGDAGDGKSHYIENELRNAPHHLKIAVNEAFTPLTAIKKLAVELPTDIPKCAVYFNFTMLPPGESVDDQEKQRYNQLIETIGWFFFDLFILGYVEDPVTGHSFRCPGGMEWAVYVEVPSRIKMNSEMCLTEFFEDIPALGLLGTPYEIHPDIPYVVNEEVQLVCKYLKAFKIGGSKGINKLYKEGGMLSSKSRLPIKFSLEADLSELDCEKLLNLYTPQHMKRNKASRKLFIRYMRRRCAFLDSCPAFNYNPGSSEYIKTDGKGKKRMNDTSQLGSTLMETMLREVSDFCDPFIRENWSLKPHHQLIYDFKDGGGTFGLLSLHPDTIAFDDKEKFNKIGVDIPSMLDLYSREWLDSYLSRALDVPLENGRLAPIDEYNYVLTLDFAIKMLNIHERAQCGIPVIIEGETGVGKTALIEMLSRLWNYSLIKNCSLYKDRLLIKIKDLMQELSPECIRASMNSIDAMTVINSGKPLREEDLMLIGEIKCDGGEQFSYMLREELLGIVGDPMLSMLEMRKEDIDPSGVSTLSMLVASAKFKSNPKEIARLLYRLLNCEVKNFFYKLNVHAALEPSEIMAFFEPIFRSAKELDRAYDRFHLQTKAPFITVFLDEVNTSSCLGLFKEIIVDHTIDGMHIPSNIFVIGACNPHRGHSLATVLKKETWIRGTYYVRQLHPTLQCLMWDYGALGEKQEQEYIAAKMKISNEEATSSDQATLTDLILRSQNLMRKYANEQLQDCGLSDGDAAECSRSSVSQRDIQRVFTFYEWLYKMYKNYRPFGSSCDYNFRALLVSLGIVYYLRLDTKYRNKYAQVLNHQVAPAKENFVKTFEEELNWYVEHICIPDGIAKTQALKENLFTNIVCTMTHTPLIIVGQPGSSKTLSFNLTLANLKGQESKIGIFRQTDIFKSLDPHFYQCSRHTTSKEIQTVFSRAITRQRSHQRVPLPVYCVVFMDEAGLPEERHESLKVLHYYLDTTEVSFVAISNHVLDAAKTNRAVSLFRPDVTQEDLVTLAQGCLCQTPDKPPVEMRRDLQFIAKLVPAYDTVMRKSKYSQFFGLRDFIHFVSYLKRKRKEMLSPQLVMEALERNFNGVDKQKFDYITKIFLTHIQADSRDVQTSNILDILVKSLLDHPEDSGAENEMRYKLIIDSSEDGLLVRLLFSTGVLLRDKTRIYMCSDFPGDSQLQNVNTIAAIRHSATEGHTVVMCQTDSIHESFYDLFNRRFHRIDANTGPRYFANIAIGAHIKPCRIDKDFQCIVVVKESELKSVPQPFLNRFEKYRLSHSIVLDATLKNMPPALAEVLRAVMKKTHEFLESIGKHASIYGLHEDTISSILLTMLPPLAHDYGQHYKLPNKSTPAYEVRNRIMEMTLHALKMNAGFLLPECSPSEQHLDMREVLNQVMRDAEFSGRVLRMTSESYYNSTEDIFSAVMEAFETLHHPHPERTIHNDVSINALLIISAVTQLLVRLLCKKVMQLMTSDSLCLHHQNIPVSYILNYLNHHNHFSLKRLIESHMPFLKSRTNPNKLICFTRSSQLLHQLPSQHPSSIHQQNTSESISVLKDLVLNDVDKLVFQKLSTFTSFTSINELLKTFVLSKTKQVLLLTVNMQETSRDVVNHLRVMIEEAEGKKHTTSSRKLFVLVLHFPSNKLSVPYYSSLFLQGWDFSYLDMIGFNAQGGALVDIREWFKQCYTTTPFTSTQQSIATQLHILLHDAVPVVCSRVIFGKHPSSCFNKPMNLTERQAMIKKLFFEKKVGAILCERFHSYWHPGVMVEYLEKAAQLSQQHETSLSVIDSLQNIFKNLFFDFLVHMVHMMNDGLNIDVLFDLDSSSDVVELFLEILRTIPIPKLSEIKMLGIANGDVNHESHSESFSPPKFPFFFLIASSVEKMVDQSRRDVNQSMDVLGDYSEPRPSLFHTAEQSRVQIMGDMLKIIQSKLEVMTKAEEKTCISTTVQALMMSDNLWQKYLEDFTRQKLRLEFGNTGISHKILRAAFGRLEKKSAIQRLALLHIYIHMHRVNLAKVVSILRPLDQIEVAVSFLPSLHSVQIYSPSHAIIDKPEREDMLESSQALSVFIINTLFNAISGIGMSCSSSINPHVGTQEEQEIKVWFQAYRDMISMPALKEHIYSSRSETAEAQHSIMHALFLIIRSKPSKCSENLQLALKIFNRLFDENFKATMELQGDCPRLGEIITVILEELLDSSTAFGTGSDASQIRHIVEGLLDHFFSVHQTSYCSYDIVWMLEMANMQTHWQATYLLSEIVEAEYSTDLLSKAEVMIDNCTEISDASTPHKLFVHIPMSVFKFYLHRILLASIRVRDDPVHSIMLYFQKTEVHSFISGILLANGRVGAETQKIGAETQKIGPYIPTFYQFCNSISHCSSADNTFMQQPLAHLYFLTVFEDLLTSKFGLPNLIRTSQRIANMCASASLPEDQLLLLHVEEQAMVQVVIKEVAAHLDMKDSSKINTLSSILEDLNAIFDDFSMGGGSMGGHGLVLVMHMLKEQQSFQRLVLLLTEHFSHLCDGINCLQPFHKSLTQASSLPVFRAEVSPFYLEMGLDFQTLYQHVTNAMSSIQYSHATATKTRELTRIMDECSGNSAVFNVVTASGRQTTMKKASCFKMVLWLVAYNEFFAKNRSAPELAKVVGTLTKKVEPPLLHLICCFLDTSRMQQAVEVEELSVQGPESPRLSQSPDLLCHLFCPLAQQNQDLSDCDLRSALVHLIAVAIGCGRNTHLWYSIFQPSELMDTYITGFMYDSTVGPSTQFYGSGVELTPDGLYGRHDYLKHATRGTLSLHSLFLLLWSNFACFSLSFLTQPDAEQNIAGKILSNSEPAREFSMAQMRKLWMLLGTGLGISEEEKLLLVNTCLNSLLECNLSLSTSNGVTGKLLTREGLDAYESFWHEQVFTPSWNNLRAKFSETSPFLKLNVVKEIMNMNIRYPWFPSEKTLSMAILSNASVADPLGDLYLLSRFVLEYPRLEGGMELLPGMVELYQYLHTELTYAITYKDVTTITFKRLAKVIAKHFVTSGDRKAHYEKLKTSFNKYVHLTGCTKYKRLVTVGDDTPLIHLLSYSVDGEQGSDLLYTVIFDIITFLNKFVASLMETLEGSDLGCGYFSNTIPHVHVMEFTQHYIFTRSVHRRNNLLQLILGRSHLPMAFPTDPADHMCLPQHSCLPGQLGPLVNLHMLQEDILVTCLAGMPLIENSSVSSLRVPFKFKDDGSSLFGLRDNTYDMEAIAEKLPESFKCVIEEATRKRLEYEFHSACYHTVMEVVAGLRTSISHLIKEVGALDFDVMASGLKRKTLPTYLISLYEYDVQDDSKDVFHEIGIHGITQTQHACLKSLSLAQLFSTLKLFVCWVEDGWYDFCSLQFGVKLSMSAQDKETIRAIPRNYSGSLNHLVNSLKVFSDVLVHMETNIVKAATEKSQMQLVRYLKRFQVLPQDKLMNMIPSTICLENYVSLRIAIRKLVVDMQVEVSKSGIATPEPKEDKWSDLIDDLWEYHLPYFRKKGYMVSSRPSSSNSFSGDADPSSTILSELIRSDSDQNILENLKKEPSVRYKPLSPPPTSRATEEKNLALLRQLTIQVKADEMQRRAKDLSLAEILDFLDRRGLGQYKKIFEDLEINGALLVQFQDDELRDIGITSALDRLRIITYFKRIVVKTSGIAEFYPVDAVFQFMEETKPFQQFAATFKAEGIDGELLLNANNEVMEELGVTTGVHRLMLRQKFKAKIDN